MTETREVIKRVEALLRPALEDMGRELVMVEYRLERGGMILRLYVDHAEDATGKQGITVDELVRISKELGPVLEVEEIIDSPYRLEVSSPGLDRPLARPEDIERFAGQVARITTRESLQGRKKFTGTLKGMDDDVVLLQEGRELRRIPWECVRKANLKPDIFGAN